MDDQTVRNLAEQLSHYLPGYSWSDLILQVVIIVIAAGIGAFCGEYLRNRGRHLATRADFSSLQQQLRANTEMIAQVESSIAQRDCAQREWAVLRRQKLETLLQKAHTFDDYLERAVDLSFDGRLITELSPEGEIATLGVLYIPELQRELTVLLERGAQSLKEIQTFARAIAAAKDDPANRDEILKKHRETIMRPEFKAAVDELRTAARPVLLKISGLSPDQD